MNPEPDDHDEAPDDIRLDVHHSRLIVTGPTPQENEDGQGRP